MNIFQTYAWVQRKLLEVAPLQRGFDLPRSEMREGSYPVIMSNGINGFHSEYKAKAPGVVTGRSGTIGNLHYIEDDYWPHNTSLWVTDFKGNNPKFVYHLYCKVDLNRFGTGSGVPTLNRNDVHDEIVFVPNVDEQTKISALLTTLDTIITLHKRKLDGLKELKMGYLQLMFPQEGESVPRVRFAGFKGDWEQCNLGEVAEITGGGTPDTTNYDYWDGDIDWYSPVEIGKEIYAYGSQRKITELGLKKSSAKILPANRTILFTSRAGIGDMAILKNPAATNQGFQSLVVNDNYDVYFIYSMGSKIKEYALKNASGSTFLEISGKGLSKMEVLIPSAEEQNAISNFFHNLDEQITTQQTKLDKLKQIKKAYLQKMFV